jgi:DNA-binding IscR family transcriptional regulator
MGERMAMRTIGDVHMHLLVYLADHEGAPLVTAATVLGLPLADVERVAAELVAAEMLEALPVQ